MDLDNYFEFENVPNEIKFIIIKKCLLKEILESMDISELWNDVCVQHLKTITGLDADHLLDKQLMDDKERTRNFEKIKKWLDLMSTLKYFKLNLLLLNQEDWFELIRTLINRDQLIQEIKLFHEFELFEAWHGHLGYEIKSCDLMEECLLDTRLMGRVWSATDCWKIQYSDSKFKVFMFSRRGIGYLRGPFDCVNWCAVRSLKIPPKLKQMKPPYNEFFLSSKFFQEVYQLLRLALRFVDRSASSQSALIRLMS